jgi:hypothetical protein
MLDASNTGNGTAVEEPPFDTSQQGNGKQKFTAGPSNVSLNVAVDAYRRIDNVPAWVQAMGNLIHTSGMFGVNNPAQGAIIAMDCYTTGMPLLQWPRVFHVVQGKQMMKAETMLARFLEAGGEVKWKDMGEDGKQALAQFKFAGNSYSIGYTIEDANRSGATASNDNWRKRPGEMLRARLVSKAIRMLNPGVISGMYCPEEFVEDSETNRDPNFVPVANEDNVPRIVHTTAQAPVQSAPVASAPTTTQPATSSAAPVSAFAQQVTTIRDLANKLGMPMDAYNAMLAKRGVASPAELTVEQAAELIKAMDAKLIAKGATVSTTATPGVTIGTPLTPAAPESKLNMPIVPGSPGYITTPQAVRLSELRQALNMTDLQWHESVLRKRNLNGTHELPEAEAAVIIAKLEHKLAAANPNTDPRAVADAQKTAELTAWANGATLPKPQAGPQTAAPGPS